MAKLLTTRVWILIIALFLALLAINPAPWASGIEVRSVREGSEIGQTGISAGEIILSINRQPIKTLSDYQKAINQLDLKEVTVDFQTDQGIIKHTFLGNPGFVTVNLTVVDVQGNASLKKDMLIQSVNGKAVTTDEEIQTFTKELVKKETLVIQTNKGEYAALVTHAPDITVRAAQKTNINKGLELQGGSRVIIRPVADNSTTIDDRQLQDMIAVLSNRLNVYGLADLKMRPASDLEGNKFIVIEIAGATREEVRELIGQQGKFEAKIGNDIVFRGGEGDIPFVCRNDGSCSGIRPPCQQLAEEQWACTFEFVITLSEASAKRHAEITRNLPINTSEVGSRYLSQPLDLHLDDQLVDSLQIGADLQGRETTQIAISGPGYGATEQAAYDAALKQMNKLQTVLITGSLPVKIEIEKLDTISPVLGKEFIKNSFIVGAIAIIAVTLVIYLRYRKLQITIPIMITTLSEVVLTLGTAALLQWSMDLASIAGIIAAVGTGVNDQIVITDEVLKGEAMLGWKERVKRAFFIIMAAYATTVAAMIPLWGAGAGLVRGFAVTTIIGVTVGVFITRPAYASMIGRILNK
ncbi:hypothetical protein J4208_01440 [Candidatus Woesearchaeota archaeon]|nr:hypothetical protein [Candidatus Woesearchaeota archaeon]